MLGCGCVWRRCVLDDKPRSFSAENASLLAQLAGMVMREVERRQAANKELCKAAARPNGPPVLHDRQGVMLLDMAVPKWSILLVNDAWQRMMGVTRELAVRGAKGGGGRRRHAWSDGRAGLWCTQWGACCFPR
jgi:hypothetical protein